MKGNVLFIVIDQLRADCLHGALAAYVPTPNLDRLAKEGSVFRNHFTVTAPCGPSRASLLTGLYASNHGAVRNDVPLRPGLTNLALEARKLGYEPLLFGYTDTQPDPATHHPNDPDLLVYEGIMPGFREITEMRQEYGHEWPGYLLAKGYPIDLPLDQESLYCPADGKLGGPAMYRAEDSDTAYLTDRTLEALDIRRSARPWFAHVTYIRPHPPFVAPAPYNSLVDPAKLPPPAQGRPDHRIFDAWFSAPSKFNLFSNYDGWAQNLTPGQIAILRATYLGLIAEVDCHVGRLLDWLDDTGQAENTLIVVTADHGEMLGDHGLWGKDMPLRPAFHIPLLIRWPGMLSSDVSQITESVDLMPTIVDWMGREAWKAGDGRNLKPLICGQCMPEWRSHAHFELQLSDTQNPTRFEQFLSAPGLRAFGDISTDRMTANFHSNSDNILPGIVI